jgi:hypothetical protein
MALLLVGKRASLIITILTIVLLTTFSILIVQESLYKGRPVGSGNLTTWVALATVLMIILITETLLLLFFRFQESAIISERKQHSEWFKRSASWKNRIYRWSSKLRKEPANFYRAIKSKPHCMKLPKHQWFS